MLGGEDGAHRSIPAGSTRLNDVRSSTGVPSRIVGQVDIRRADQRFHTELDWLNSWHSFSFGPHYDHTNTHHGALLVNNDDTVAAGGGFNSHPHRDMEIVTWVLRGVLAHQDSEGHSGVIYPGLAQTMSAGRGIVHSERNDSATEPVHFVQMWVMPDETGLTPGYRQAEVSLGDGLVTVASGIVEHDAAIPIHNQNAALHVASLDVGDVVRVPSAAHVHVFMATGAATLEGVGALGVGDAVRLTADDGRRVTATEPAEVLIWEMRAGVGSPA